MEREGQGEIIDRFLVGLANGIKEKSLGLLKENDTVLIFKSVDEKTLEVHVLSADSPPQMKDALAKFYQHFKSAGIERLESYTQTPAMIRILQQAGIPVQFEKQGSRYKIEVEVR